MTAEEIKALHHDMHKGVKMMIETLEDLGKKADSMTLADLMCLSDILKDMSEVEKNIAKAERL